MAVTLDKLYKAAEREFPDFTWLVRRVAEGEAFVAGKYFAHIHSEEDAYIVQQRGAFLFSYQGESETPEDAFSIALDKARMGKQ